MCPSSYINWTCWMGSCAIAWAHKVWKRSWNRNSPNGVWAGGITTLHEHLLVTTTSTLDKRIFILGAFIILLSDINRKTEGHIMILKPELQCLGWCQRNALMGTAGPRRVWEWHGNGLYRLMLLGTQRNTHKQGNSLPSPTYNQLWNGVRRS